MSGIQKRLNALQPHVLSIRCVKGITVVDAVFNEGWTIPKSEIIETEKGDGDVGYYMFYSQKEDIGVDELLDYIEKIIEINVERELKFELLKEKVEELKKVFSKTPLAKLKTMKFTFGSDALVSETMSEEDIKVTPEEIIPPEEKKKPEEPAPKKGAVKKPNVKQGENFRDIELPPKKGEKIVLESHDLPPEMKEGECTCGPTEACPKCIDKKEL